MSSNNIEDYASDKYITLEDALRHVGYSDATISSLPAEVKARFINWTKEANGNVESDTYIVTDGIPLPKGTPQYTFARNAALNWVMYKKRDWEGAKNSTNAKNDYDRDIKSCIELIRHTPTQRTYPIETSRTHSLANRIIPYSQSNGYPPDLLY
jgi:hypothetical protein